MVTTQGQSLILRQKFVLMSNQSCICDRLSHLVIKSVLASCDHSLHLCKCAGTMPSTRNSRKRALKEAIGREGSAHASWVDDPKRPSKEVPLPGLYDYIWITCFTTCVPRSRSLECRKDMYCRWRSWYVYPHRGRQRPSAKSCILKHNISISASMSCQCISTQKDI